MIRYRKFNSMPGRVVEYFDCGSDGSTITERFDDVANKRFEAIKFLETLKPEQIIGITELNDQGRENVVIVYYRTIDLINEE